MADVTSTEPTRPRYLRTLGSGVLLGVSMILLGWTAARAMRVESIWPAAAITPISDPKERAARQHDVLGTFATGNQPGDRIITIQADGTMRFQLVGPLAKSLSFSDTYQFGLINKGLYLATAQSGLIEALDIDQLAYLGDTYRRTK